MPTATASLRHDNEPRASIARVSAELANATALYSLNRSLTAGGAARATTTTKAKTVNTITQIIGGAFGSLAATDNLWTLGVTGSNTTVAVSSFQKYLLLLDNTATPVATVQEGLQSTVSAATVLWSNIANYSAWAPLISILNANKQIAAVLTIATDSTHTFVPGTTALNAAGITATFVDGLDPTLLPCIGNEAGNLIGSF